MSRSNPTIENPSQRWHEWKGSTGKVYYWDKEQSKEIPVGPPFSFLMLDIMTTIRGYSEKWGDGIYANEIRSLDQNLKVKTYNGNLIAEGKYDNIKDTIKANGGKFAKSVYLAFYDENQQLQIGNFMFVGASLGAWIEFEKKVGRRSLEQGAVVITGATQEQTGKTKYFVPTISLKQDVSDEAQQRAIEMDKELQEYLENKTDHVDIPEEEPEEDDSFGPSSSSRSNPQPEPNGKEHAEAMHGPPKGPHPAQQEEPVDMSGELEDIDSDLPF